MKRYTGSISAYLEERSMPEPNSGCQLWLNCVGSHGYGQTKLLGVYLLAHRLAWESVHGPIPYGLEALHKCDVRSCINVAHLFLGTHDDNHADKINKGRQARGAKNGAAKLTDEEARAIYFGPGLHQDIADRYTISRTIVTNIKNRKIWRHATEPPPPEAYDR